MGSCNSNQNQNLQEIFNWKFDSHKTPQNSKYTFQNRLCQKTGWTQNYTKIAIKQYQRFIYIYCITKKAYPSKVIDTVWQFHLLSTINYRVMCQTFNGEFIYHQSYDFGGNLGLYGQTRRDYLEIFGVEPVLDYWPLIVYDYGGNHVNQIQNHVIQQQRHVIQQQQNNGIQRVNHKKQ